MRAAGCQPGAFAAALEVKCLCDFESMVSLLTADPDWVVILSDPGQAATASLVKSLQTRSIEVPLVFLLPEGSTERVIDALRLGASGVVYGSDNLAELAACIDRVSQGRIWLKHVNLGMICRGLHNRIDGRPARREGLC